MIDELPSIPDHKYINVICIHCGHRVDVPIYCGNRFCTVCSQPRRKRVRDRLNFLISNRPKVNGTMLKHLTLTVRNDPDLKKMVKHLIDSFRKMRNRKLFRRLITGGAFVIELTNKGNYWHAHLHIIIQSLWIERDDIMNMWFQCSSGNTGVYIRNIPPTQAVRYLTKYVSKSDLPPDLQLEASDVLKDFRLFSPFGSWYDLNMTYTSPPTFCSACHAPSQYLPFDIFIGEWKVSWIRIVDT